MGLGKTIQAAVALQHLAQESPGKYLIVAPAPLLLQWRQELRKWAPGLRFSTVTGKPSDRAWQWRARADIFLVSYDTLRQDFTTNQHAPVAREWDVVVLDEAQRIKNRDADISRVCKRLARKRAWALTGTPLENSLDDVASIVEFVCPLRPGERPVRVDAGPSLKDIHERVQLRRRKQDVLKELPPKTFRTVPIELCAGQRATYDRAEREGIVWLQGLGGELRVQHVLELITRLKQICNVCPQSGESAKLDDLAARMDTIVAEGDRALIFSQYVDPAYGVPLIASHLRKHAPLTYTGAMDAIERENVIERFRREDRHRALVLSLRAGGQGLNLQEASYVVHFDRWWNPAVERQAEDRSHRLGQTAPVFVYAYIAADTIEERIDKILAQKQALFDQVVDETSMDLRQSLSETELFALFGMSKQTA